MSKFRTILSVIVGVMISLLFIFLFIFSIPFFLYWIGILQYIAYFFIGASLLVIILVFSDIKNIKKEQDRHLLIALPISGAVLIAGSICLGLEYLFNYLWLPSL